MQEGPEIAPPSLTEARKLRRAHNPGGSILRNKAS